ncbi:MAG: YbaY family lipoprotein [Spirochaetia bacterium]
MRLNLVKVIFLGMITLFVFSCKTTQPATKAAKPLQSVTNLSGMLDGHVRYLERIALPEAFWVEVQLVQLKSDGTPGPVLARAMTEKPTRTIPVPFMMRYSPKSINAAEYRYALIASIYVGKKLWFQNQEPYPIFRGSDRNIDIIAQRVM